MYGWNLEPNWTRKQHVRGLTQAGKRLTQWKATWLNGQLVSDHHEAVVQVGGVQECTGLPGLLQDGQHDLVPQLPVKAKDLLDVAEQLGGLHLRQQAALLQVDQPTQEELQDRQKRSRLKLAESVKAPPQRQHFALTSVMTRSFLM